MTVISIGEVFVMGGQFGGSALLTVCFLLGVARSAQPTIFIACVVCWFICNGINRHTVTRRIKGEVLGYALIDCALIDCALIDCACLLLIDELMLGQSSNAVVLILMTTALLMNSRVTAVLTVSDAGVAC